MITHRDQLGLFMSDSGFTTCAEIGVQCGVFSKTILSTWDTGHINLIDAWQHFNPDDYLDISNLSNDEQNNNMLTTIKNVSPFTGRYTILQALSHEACHKFDDKYFDLIYLDANHSYKNVYEDISCWINKVKIGGYISGHDYLDGNLAEGVFGVKSAVCDFFGKDPDFVTQEKWPSWFIRVGA